MAKTAIDVFRDILEKDKLERNDLELLIDRILVFEDHLEIKLKTDIDTLLRCGTLPRKRRTPQILVKARKISKTR